MSAKPQLGLAALGLSAALAGAAAGDEAQGPYPNVSGEVAIEVQNDRAYRSDDGANEFNTLFTKIEPAFTVQFAKPVSLFAGLVLEPVQSRPADGRNQTFDNEGLYVQVLSLTYATDRFSVFAGKFTPNFGIAWDAAPGIYGTDFAEDYELAERIGLGGTLSLGGGSRGRHTLSASAFFLDTSGLAGSALTRRRKAREADGGPANTGDLGSFAVGLDGGEFRQAPGLRYHLAFADQAKGRGNDKDEAGLAVGLEYAVNVTDAVGLTPLVECARFNAAEATAGQDRDICTAGLALTRGSWNLALAGARRDTDAADGTRTRDKQLQLSAGYAFANGVGLDVGWMTNRLDGVDTDTVGALLTYALPF